MLVQEYLNSNYINKLNFDSIFVNVHIYKESFNNDFVYLRSTKVLSKNITTKTIDLGHLISIDPNYAQRHLVKVLIDVNVDRNILHLNLNFLVR